MAIVRCIHDIRFRVCFVPTVGYLSCKHDVSGELASGRMHGTTGGGNEAVPGSVHVDQSCQWVRGGEYVVQVCD